MNNLEVIYCYFVPSVPCSIKKFVQAYESFVFWRVLLCVNLKNMEHSEHSEHFLPKCLILFMFHVCSMLSVLMEHSEHSEQNAF